MRNITAFIIGLIFALTLQAAPYPPIKVSGAGAVNTNGTYVYTSLENGRPKYVLDNTAPTPDYYLAYDSTNSRWRIYLTSPSLTEAYRVSSTARTPDLIVGTWSTQIAGQSPVPTISAMSRLVLDGGSIIEAGARKTWDAGALISGAAGRYTLVVGTPTSTPRALPGSSGSTTVQDRTVQSITGSATVTDFTWNWTPADSNTIPGTVTRTSLSPSIITPHATNPYLWSFVSNGTATIRLTTSTGINYNRSVTTSTSGGGTTSTVTGYASGSLRKHLFDTFTAKLAGKSAATDMRLFSTYNAASASFVRNASCWAYGSAGGVTWDLTSISPGNSGANNLWAGILISPRHILLSAHASMANGSTIYFVKQDGTLISRVMTSASSAPGYTNYYPDWRVGVLDSDIPTTDIKPAKILPDDWASKLPGLDSSSPIPSIGLDQEEKATIQDIYSQGSSSGMYGAMVYTTTPLDATRAQFFETKIGGDSGNPLVTPIGNELVVWTVWTFGGAGSGTSVWYHKAAINSVMEAQTDAPYITTTTSKYASTPDSATLDIAGDIDIRAKIDPDALTGSGYRVIAAKWGTTPQWSYFFAMDAAGKLFFSTSTGGGAQVTSLSSAALADSNKRWVRVTRDVNNGAGGQSTFFYTSPDGVTWTQLGTTQTSAGTTSIFNSTAPLYVGCEGGTASWFPGKIYYVEVRNGIDGTLVARMDPIKFAYTGSSYTESVGSAVWTLNGAPTVGGYALQEINLGAYNSY